MTDDRSLYLVCIIMGASSIMGAINIIATVF